MAANNSKPLTDEWRSWLRLNMTRGCSEEILFDRCVRKEGFASQDVLALFISESKLASVANINKHKHKHKTADRTEHQNKSDDAKKTSAVEKTILKSSNKMMTRESLQLTTTTTSLQEEQIKEQADVATVEKKANNIAPQNLDNGWKEWMRLRLDQGASKEDIFEYCCFQERLDMDQVSHALGGYRARTLEDPWQQQQQHHSLRSLPFFTRRSYQPRAWRLDTQLAEIYEIPKFLSKEECKEAMQVIDEGVLQRSVVTNGSADSRTSQTCHLRLQLETDIIARLEQKLHAMMGSDHDPACAETLQGQVYEVGAFFQAHTDWFAPNTGEYEKHCQSKGGQRTWTVMVYLNSIVEGSGGETKFELLEREFIPRQGMAVAWNNLDADGITPNPWTLHEAMPVTQGKKYILTKWFRERSMN